MKQNLPIIISLTSSQLKIKNARETILSLLTQSVKADKVILWLSRQGNALDEGVQHLPESITQLENRGLEIRWTKNIGPYRKLVPTAKLMNRENCLIVIPII